MTIKTVGVIGGAGFVGSSIVTKLDDAGYQVKVLTRHRERARHLILLPHVQVQTCNLQDDANLKEALSGCDAVINLVGILHESKNNRFDTAHHQLPKRIAAICEALGIKRLLHMSALQANEQAPSEYLRSKAKGEAALSAFQQRIDITVFKPSVIFGRHDSFLNLFATLIKWMPVIFLAKPKAKFQPIWVEDVATIFVHSLDDDRTFGQSYELAGPAIYRMRELVEKVMQQLNQQRVIIGLSDTLSYFQAWLMEWLPIKLMTRDNVRSMEVDSVSNEPMASEIAIPLTPLEAVIPAYLKNKTARGAYHRFRTAAGRAINARR
jgi:NADH dehydrogenase